MEETITTTDMDLIMNLLILRHQPCRVELTDGLVKYTFKSADIKDDIERISRNESITVDLRDVWSANRVWSMNRSRAKGR